MSKIKWIQLSDLHFGRNSPFCQNSREELRDFISKHRKDIDYMFITGDIIYAADATTPQKKAKAYQDAERYLKDICRSLWGDSGLDDNIHERVFIVPGNHDLIQNQARRSLINGLRKDYSDGREGTIDASYLENTRNAMKHFFVFYDKLASRKNMKNMRKKMHFVVETDQINVLHINTCVSSSSSKEDDGNLIIGYDLINDALSSIQNSKPTIAIAHHSFEFLNRQEKKKLELALKEKDVCLYLCGHAHERESNLLAHYNQRKVLSTYTCGTLMAEGGGNREINTTVFLGELDIGSKVGQIRSFIWDLDNRWHDDMDFGLVQDPKGDQGNCRYFGPSRFAGGDAAKLLTDGTDGITAQIVSHLSPDRKMAFLQLNKKAQESLSIYGIGITSVSKDKDLLTRILSAGGKVQLCMVDPDVFKSETDGHENGCFGQHPPACGLKETNFCVYGEHMNKYMRDNYYRDMKDSYDRLQKFQQKTAQGLPGEFKVKILRSFIPMSINIINENTDRAELIIEYNMPFKEKRLLLQLSKKENEEYYSLIKEIFDSIFEEAVDVKW